MNLLWPTDPSRQCFGNDDDWVNTYHTIRIDKIEGEYDLHDEYSMIEIQLVLKGLNDCSDDETETIDNRIGV